MTCKRCGKNVPVHSKVCPECGLSNPNYVPRPEERPTSYSSYSSRPTTPPKTAPNPRPATQSKPAPGPKPTQAQQAAGSVPPQGQSAAKPASTGSGSSLKNFLILAAIVIGIIFLLKNCDTMRLKGTWEASDGSAITFSDKDSGYLVMPGTMGSQTMNFTYFVDGDELELKTAGSLYAYSVVVRYEFEIDGSTLYLTDLDTGLTETFRKR